MTTLLDEAGVAWRVEPGRKHDLLVFTFGGREHRHTSSRSKDSWRDAKKAASDIRRILRGPSPPQGTTPQDEDQHHG